MNKDEITNLSEEIYQSNVLAGWWDDWEKPIDRYHTALMLIVSEIAEAMEGDRKNLMDDHLTDYKMFDVELADTMIRLLDLAGAYSVDFNWFETDTFNRNIEICHVKELKIPEQLFYLTQTLCEKHATPDFIIYRAIVVLVAIAEFNDVNLWHIVKVKREYNLTRIDHSRKTRAGVNGKKY